MSKTQLPTESDEVYGARVMAGVMCDGCGSLELLSIHPGHEGHRVNLLGESGEGPGRTFALTPDRVARGWCMGCWPWSPSRNTAGPAHGAISPAASQHAEWVGEHSQDRITS